MPRNDLDDYAASQSGVASEGSPQEGSATGGSAGASQDAPASEDPGSPSTGGNAAAGSASSGNGSGSSGGLGGTPGAGSSSSSPDAGDREPADATAPTPACAEGELEGPTDSCFFLDAQTQTFFATRNACRARGSGWDLASVRSAEVSAFLGDVLTFEAWLVGSDVANEGNWVWLDDGSPFWQGGASGTPVGGAYSNWDATEPNGGDNTNCLRVLPRAAGSANPEALWADLACNAIRGGICEGPLR